MKCGPIIESDKEQINGARITLGPVSTRKITDNPLLRTNF